MEEVTKKDLQMFRMESYGGQDSCYVPGQTKAVSHIERANKFISGTNNYKTGTRPPPPSPMEPGPGPGSLSHSLVLSARFVIDCV